MGYAKLSLMTHQGGKPECGLHPALPWRWRQVTVAVVRYESLKRQRIGVTSTYLAERLAVCNEAVVSAPGSISRRAEPPTSSGALHTFRVSDCWRGQ